MNRQEKEVRNQNLSDEAQLLSELYSRYEDATAELEYMIKELMLDLDDPKVVYQMEYQSKLESQIQDILSRMNSQNTEEVKSFLNRCAELGFIGAIYSMYSQGYFGNITIDTIVNSDAELRLAVHSANLAKDLQGEITRGVAGGKKLDSIMQNVSSQMSKNFNKVGLVARTEGGRVFEQNNYIAMVEAQKDGAVLMKEWSSVMDSKVRPDHLTLHGQRVPIDEPFVLESEDGNTYTAMYPHDFGVGKEDINCRCTAVPRVEGLNGSVTDGDYKNYDGFKKALLAGLLVLTAIKHNRQDKS